MISERFATIDMLYPIEAAVQKTIMARHPSAPLHLAFALDKFECAVVFDRIVVGDKLGGNDAALRSESAQSREEGRCEEIEFHFDVWFAGMVSCWYDLCLLMGWT